MEKDNILLKCTNCANEILITKEVKLKNYFECECGQKIKVSFLLGEIEVIGADIVGINIPRGGSGGLTNCPICNDELECTDRNFAPFDADTMLNSLTCGKCGGHFKETWRAVKWEEVAK